MSTINRLEDRQRISDLVRTMRAQQSSVQEHPEVTAARKAREEARRNFDLACEAFNKVFLIHYPSDRHILRVCQDAVPDVVVGNDGLPLRCVATGLAILEGDDVYGVPSDDEHDVETAVLVQAVATDAPATMPRYIATNVGRDNEDDDYCDSEEALEAAE